MLVHSNATVTIQRLQDNAGARTYQNLYTGIRVYLQSKNDDVQEGFDNQWAWTRFLMMTDWTLDLIIWDKIIDQNNKSYTIKTGENFSDLTGKHGEYILTLIAV